MILKETRAFLILVLALTSFSLVIPHHLAPLIQQTSISAITSLGSRNEPLVGNGTGPSIDIAGESAPDRQRVETTIAVDPRNPNIIVAGAQDLSLNP